MVKKYYEKEALLALPVLEDSGIVEVGTGNRAYQNMRFDIRQDGSLFIVSTAYLAGNGQGEHIPSQYCPVFILQTHAEVHMNNVSCAVENYDELAAYREKIGDPLNPLEEARCGNE